MNFDHIKVILMVLAAMVIFISVLEIILSFSSNKKYHRFDLEFEQIVTLIDERDYEGANLLINTVLRKCERGANDVRAKSYKALIRVKLGKADRARRILISLTDIYPGIRDIYAQYLNEDQLETDEIIYIIESIQNEYLEITQKSITNGISWPAMLGQMNFVEWAHFLSMLTGAVVVYDQYKNKWKAK